MIDDELRAAFARHEFLAPAARELAPRVARAVRRRRSRRAVLRASTAALAVAAVAVLPSLHGMSDPSRPGHHTAAPPSTPPVSAARNLLVVGSDERRDVPGSGRADAVLLLHLAADGRHAYLMSLPRDTVLPDPACGPGLPGRLICPLKSGGPAAEADAVSRLTGVRIDGVVSVRFAGLVAVVDALGGVDLTVDQQVRSIDTHRVFRVGRVHLSGAEALDYVRQRRGLAGGDLDRERHQQQLLAALLRRATSQGVLANPVRLAAVLHAADNAIAVRPAGLDLVGLARGYRQLRADTLVGLTVPGHTAQQDTPAHGPVAVFLLDPGADALFRALAGDAVAPFVAGHPELVWPLGS